MKDNQDNFTIHIQVKGDNHVTKVEGSEGVGLTSVVRALTRAAEKVAETFEMEYVKELQERAGKR